MAAGYRRRVPLLEVDHLRVTLQTSRGAADALRGISFAIERGQTLGLIGESGCGKSITALALMGLLPAGALVRGSIRFGGTGTAWGWTFPSFCEALVLAWDSEPSAVAAARTYLSSMRDLMRTGCAGHIAEVFDGDAPHAARGCDAQAWSATEALRVWVNLQRSERAS